VLTTWTSAVNPDDPRGHEDDVLIRPAQPRLVLFTVKYTSPINNVFTVYRRSYPCIYSVLGRSTPTRREERTDRTPLSHYGGSPLAATWSLCFFFFLLRLRFLGGELSISSGGKSGAPVRFKSGGENAGWVGESEVVEVCRTGETEGDPRCGFGDTMGDGAPTSGGTTATGNSNRSEQKDKNGSTSHLYGMSNNRTYLNAMTMAW